MKKRCTYVYYVLSPQMIFPISVITIESHTTYLSIGLEALLCSERLMCMSNGSLCSFLNGDSDLLTESLDNNTGGSLLLLALQIITKLLISKHGNIFDIRIGIIWDPIGIPNLPIRY